MKKRTFIRRISIAAAVVIAIVAVIIPVGMSNTALAQSERTLTSALDQMSDIDNYIVKFKTRTTPNENFAFIDVKADFVDATFCRSFRSPSYWSIEKQGGRSAIFNGDSVYVWTAGSDLGFSFSKESQYGVLETFSILLNPKQLLEYVLLSLSTDQSNATIEKSEELITVTVETEASGDFTNDYALNTLVAESHNRMMLVFDKKSQLLSSFKVDIMFEGRFVTVLQSEQIAYGQQIQWATKMMRPDIMWRDLSVTLNANSLSKLTASQAVTEILRALSNSDWAATYNSFYYYDRHMIEDKFFGLQVMAVSRAFSSGDYPGQFVPCRLKLKNGEILEANIAIRNDNDNRTWLIDGGI